MSTAHHPQRFRRTVADLVFGTDAGMRPAIQRMLLTVPFYLVCVGFEVTASLALGPVLLLWLAAYTSLGIVAFYVVLRTGWSLRCADPRLVFPQVMFAVTASVMAYISADAMHSTAIELMSVAIVFDMHRLNVRQIVSAVATGVTLLWAALFGLWLSGHPDLDMDREVSNLTMTVFALGAVFAVALQSLRVRRQQTAHHAALTEAVRRVRHVADHDTLTGLANRRKGETAFQAMCTDTANTALHLAVALIDVDHFKHINDAHGHATGDAVLRTLAALLQSCMNPGQLLARWGGEEFLLLMPGTTSDEALQLVERGRLVVMNHDWSVLAPGLHVTVSAGVTCAARDEPLYAVVQHADTLLYSSKCQGRNRTQRA